MRVTDHTPLVAGIDLGGSQMAITLWRGEYCLGELICKGSGDTRGAILADVVERTASIIWQDVDYIFIEEPIVGRGVRASMQLSQMLGCWWGALGGVGLADRVHLVPVTTWKKHTVGNAHAKKEDVASWLKENFPDYYERCDGSQDLIDATCIGLYGARVCSQSRSLDLTGSAEQPDEPATWSDPA